MLLRELRIETTKACNYACVHCYTVKSNHGAVSVARFLALVDEAHQLGTTAISITGGEPLIQADLTLSVARRAKSHGMSVRLNTNGHLIGRTCSAQDLLDAVNDIQISYHAANAADFDAFVRHPGAFKAVSAAVSSLCAFRSSAVSFRFSLMPANAHQLLPVTEAAAALKIGKLKVRTVVPTKSDQQWTPTDCERIRAALHASMALATEAGLFMEVHSEGIGTPIASSAYVTTPPCSCGSTSLFLSADGDLYPCVFVRENPSLRVGNVCDSALGETVRGWADTFSDGCGGCTAARIGTGPHLTST